MSGNSFGRIFRLTSYGESHGAAVGAVVDGCPSGLQLSEQDIQAELDKRVPGGEYASPRAERDRVQILSGLFQGFTTGAPIHMLVWNTDVRTEDYEPYKYLLRPGHADYTYLVKYGIRDWRGGGRSSGRETLARVAAGAIAKKLIGIKGVKVIAHCIQIGNIRASPPSDLDELVSRRDSNPMRCADLDAAKSMMELVERMRARGDTLGGLVEVIIHGVPPGLGEPVFDKLDADLAKALMSIGGVKGVEIGLGFGVVDKLGSQVNDEFYLEGDRIRTRTNNAGGILGGISTGEDIICRIAVKPPSSIQMPQSTLDISTMKPAKLELRGRFDPVIAPRIVPVAEAMCALVIADHMLMSGMIPRRLCINQVPG